MDKMITMALLLNSLWHVHDVVAVAVADADAAPQLKCLFITLSDLI